MPDDTPLGTLHPPVTPAAAPAVSPAEAAAPAYPAHWEADVVLRDGRPTHLRPIEPRDAERLVQFYARVSDESKYFRFFAAYPELTARDVLRFTTVDYTDRVAIIALVRDEMIGVVRYDRIPDAEIAADPHAPQVPTAEVAFLIQDDHQGRGLGSVLLEHLAAVARERGVERFVAEILPANRKMINVLREVGYSVRTELEEGVVKLAFNVADTETAVEVRRAREHRAEARSTERLLHPRSVVVVGASRRPESLGQTVLRNLRDGVGSAGFPGLLAAVHPEADEIAGVPAYRSVGDVPGEIDLAVVAVPADRVEAVVAECAAKSVRGLVVVSAGFAETGEEGRERQRRLVQLARASGMRVVGPNSFGLVNTDPQVSLNATLAAQLPERGRIGMFAQSGALGVAILASARRRGLGLSTFVSAGNRADVSGNDLLQFWEEDPATDAVLLYLESVGNPRKFARLARRVGRSKPVAAVRSGRLAQAAPLGHAVRDSRAPLAAIDAVFRQAGVIRVDDIHQLFDVGQVLATQPLPRGRRVAVVDNSHALGILAADAAALAGLDVAGEPRALGAEATAADFEAALAAALDDPEVDSVVTVFMPPLALTGEDVTRVVAETAARSDKTVVATFLGLREGLAGSGPGVEGLTQHPVGPSASAPASPGTRPPPRPPGTSVRAIPAYPSPEDAVRALAAVTDYAQWRARPHGTHAELEDVDRAAARQLVEKLLAGAPLDGEPPRELTAGQAGELLGHYGVDAWPWELVASPDDAVEAAQRLGYPVVLKATLPHLRHRPELGEVRLDLGDESQLRGAYAGMVDALGPEAIGKLLVQRQAPPGVAVVIGSMEDPLFGPVVSFGLGGLATELLGDRSYASPPLTDLDVAELVRSVRAAPMLFGHRGGRAVDVPAVEDLLLRVSALADDLPEVAELELNPVLVDSRGLTVLGARVLLAHPQARADRGPRAMST